MAPITFGNCFGWLHEGWGDIGVVICPGIGWDAHKAHGSLRLLADDLARLGYPTLRFDYQGTGDAKDLDGKDFCAAWLESVTAASGWLRATGVRQLVFCGVRLGALLAGVVATQRDDIRAIVLLDPVTSGSSYLREVSIAAGLAPGLGENALEIAGLQLASRPDASLRELSLLTMRSMPARHILILTSSASPALARLAGHMRLLGADVAQAAFEPMMEYDSSGQVKPGVDLGRIGDWLRQVATPVPWPKLQQRMSADMSTGEFVECPVRFGPAQSLFGMLCRPTQESEPGFVLIIGSVGAVPHYGFARFHVRLARRLAAAGIASLRFDFKGIGDSLPDAPTASTHVYEVDRTLDMAAAIDALQDLGYNRFAVAGLCSGAYHAFRASLADDRVQALLMLNPATFVWHEGQTFARFQQDNHRSTRFYLGALAHRRGWARLVRGELDIAKAARTVCKHALRRLAAVGARVAGSLEWPTEGEFPRRAMQRLSARGVRILLLMGTMDGGLDMVLAHFGRGGRWLAALPGGAVSLIPDLDHNLSRISMQEKAVSVVLNFIQAGRAEMGRPAEPEREDYCAHASEHRETACLTPISP